MERAKVIWDELGLPPLKPESPWFGYSLGEWSPEFDEAAARATRGDYFVTGEELEKRRRKDVKMNTEVRTVKKSKPKSKYNLNEEVKNWTGQAPSARALR